MSDSSSSSSVEIGFTGLLSIAFIILKLLHVIDWRWLWVLAPLWIGGGIALLASILLLIFTIRN